MKASELARLLIECPEAEVVVQGDDGTYNCVDSTYQHPVGYGWRFVLYTDNAPPLPDLGGA